MEHYDKTLFVLIMIVLPVGLILLSGFVRCLTTHKTKDRHFYLGIDLTLGAFTVALVSGVDPPSRVMTAAQAGNNTVAQVAGHTAVNQASSDLVSFTFSHGATVAIILDLFLVFIAMVIQMEFEKYCERVPNPTKRQRWGEWVLMMGLHNAVGVVAMALSAYVLRY